MGAATKLITHLSFSRLKELHHSPLKMKAYLEKTFEPTDAMNQGSLLDCLLFEPELLNERFYVIPEDAPRRPSSVQRNAKKPSDSTLEAIAFWDAVEEMSKDKITVTPSQMDSAKYLSDCIRNNSTVTYHGLLNPDFFNFQVKVEFFYNGFLHRGIKDADGTARNGEKVIWDLKRMGARSGEQLVRSQIRANKYDLQAAIYCHEYDSKSEPVKYYVIAVDNDGYVTPFEITRDARNQARIEWNKLIKAAHRCNMEGLDMGTEFWAGPEGFFYY